MKIIKRFLCIILAVVIFVSAPLTSYMEARAVEFIAVPFIEELLVALGISFGLGAQNDFSTQLYNNNLEDYFNAAASGGTFTLPEYGTVDFSDAHSVLSLFDWCMKANMSLLTGDPSYMDSPLEDIDAAYADAALQLDLISYHNTGTCATNAMNDSISEFYEEFETAPEQSLKELQEYIRTIFVLGSMGGPNGDDDDDEDEEERSERNKKIWKVFSAITAAGMIGFGNTAVPFAALKEYSDSEFSEYDAVFGEAYFDGNYKTNADGKYVYHIRSDVSLTDTSDIFHPVTVPCVINTVYALPVAGYRSGDDIVFVTSSGAFAYLPVDNSHITCFRIFSSGFSGNIPVYPTSKAAMDALESGDFSDAENIQSSYADFKSNTEGAGAVVGSAFSNYIGSLRSLADISNIVGDISDASNTYGGTAKALEEVADILNNAAGVAVSKPGTDDPDGSSGNYLGILGKILTAINNLPVNILNKFVSKFMTADSLTKLINNLPTLFVNPFKEMLELVLSPVIAAINFLPDGMQARLIELFPNSVAIGNAIIGFPDAVVQAVKGIVVNVPDIKIPEIEIPEIKIPEITIPDVFVEVNPNITLDPSYNITVKNDYLGLGDIISGAVNKVLTDVFVPNEAAALEKVDEMKEYFMFKDDMEEIVGEFEKKVFGIKPSPILKIPIGKPTSKKYNFGTGNYIIIDVSWYAQYKDFGDKIILAFAWALFIWRIFVHLPGIISGAPGVYEAGSQAQTIFSLRRDSKND